jgi:beta-galactosidase
VRRVLVLCFALFLLIADAGHAAGFPKGFLWGVANAGFQSEMGQGRNVDRGSDWWVWAHDRKEIAAKHVTGDRPERSNGDYALFRRDIDLAAGLGLRGYRFDVEWSRIFPRSTASVKLKGDAVSLADLRRLDRLADPAAVTHYRAELEYLHRRGLTPLVTVNHFTLPVWLHDPVATRDALAKRGANDPLPALRRGGWLDDASVGEFRKYAAYLAWKFGPLVKLWNPINEPLVVTTNGYVNVPGAFAGWFPPGAFSFSAAVRSLQNLIAANAAAYDAIHRFDRGARVGLVQNMIAFTPADPGSAADRAAADHADYLFNRLFLAAAIQGRIDDNADGTIQAGEQHPDRAGKADFIGVNYYFRGRVSALGSPLTPVIPVLDFVPSVSYRTALNPTGPACPTTCSDLGSEVYPQGLTDVLRTAGRYRKPVYITENGIADAKDSLRPGYLVSQLEVLRRAIAAKVADVRGYFHWTLVDNFEWAAGYRAPFGLYRFDPATLVRTPRTSASVYRQIVKANAIPPALAKRYG